VLLLRKKLMLEKRLKTGLKGPTSLITVFAVGDYLSRPCNTDMEIEDVVKLQSGGQSQGYHGICPKCSSGDAVYEFCVKYPKGTASEFAELK